MENEGIAVINGAGQGRNKVIKRPGQPPKKVMSPRVPRGGWGQNNLTGALGGIQKACLRQ